MHYKKLPGLAFLLLSLGYAWSASGIPLDFWSEQETFNARTLPLILAACGVLLSILLLFEPSNRVADDHQIRSLYWKDLQWTPLIILLILMSAYGFFLDYLGFLLSTFLFLITGFYILGERSVARMLMVSIPLVIGFWWLMRMLDIYLDPGIWWHFLFSENTRLLWEINHLSLESTNLVSGNTLA